MAKKKTDISVMARIGLFVIGMAIAITLIIYSVNWEQLPIQFYLTGQNVTVYFMAGLLVLVGILAHTMIKSGILGKWRLD